MEKIETITICEPVSLNLFELMKPYLYHCLRMNHELNNYLSGIIGFSQILLFESENLNDDQKQQLQHIHECSLKMNKLINNLCLEKIALGEQIDLKQLTEAFAPKS